MNTGEDALAMMEEEIQSIRNDMSQMDDQRFGSGRGGGRGRGGGGGSHRKPGCEHCVRDGKGSTCHHCWICGAGDHVSFDKQLEATDEGHSSASVNQSTSQSYDEQDLKNEERLHDEQEFKDETSDSESGMVIKWNLLRAAVNWTRGLCRSWQLTTNFAKLEQSAVMCPLKFATVNAFVN